ncbi:Protein kintoun [Cichlidogyrus casuarinus]|uniref:PIH1 domain-containing protein 1 n=1 Tax=Cichlidogyrus casuarinus TaxID=1844966 RepID=A0ABD2PWJ3_9PLAT
MNTMTQSMTKSLEDMKITDDEITRLKNAFKDPEFRKLFNEYARELEDPVNKKKYEEEIIQLENERGFDTIFINPTPHHVLKTRQWPESSKVFINVCSSDKLQEPDLKSHSKNGKSGLNISLPHSFAPPKEEIDKDKNVVQLIDVVFHPQAFELAQNDPEIASFLNTTAFTGVAKHFSLKLGLTDALAAELSMPAVSSQHYQNIINKSFHVLRGVTYKGVLRSTIIRKSKPDQDKIIAEKEKQDAQVLEETPHLQKLIKAEKKEPKYRITHGKNFDMTDCLTDPSLDKIKPSIPDYLKLEIDLPGLSAVSQFDLDLHEQRLVLNSIKPVEYHLDLKLPYPVVESEAESKFQKDTQTLTLFLPVSKLTSAQKVPSISARKTLIEELSSSPVSQTGRFLVCSSPECNLKPDLSTKVIQVPPLQLSVNKDQRLLPAKFRQDPDTFTVLGCVKNALAESVRIRWAESLEDNRPLTFSVELQSRGSGGCTIDWGLILKCPIFADEGIELVCKQSID